MRACTIAPDVAAATARMKRGGGGGEWAGGSGAGAPPRTIKASVNELLASQMWKHAFKIRTDFIPFSESLFHTQSPSRIFRLACSMCIHLT